MFNSIVIVERSVLIREGLSVIISKNRITKQLTLIESLDEYYKVAQDGSSNLLILGSEYALVCGIDRLRHKHRIPLDIPIIGLVYQYYDRSLVGQFSDIILVTDTESSILKKLEQLYTNKDENSNNDGEKLSEREKDVLKLLLKGLSNKEVADELNISPHTVISHRKNIVEKTGIRSLSGLAVYAIVNNITNIEDIKN